LAAAKHNLAWRSAPNQISFDLAPAAGGMGAGYERHLVMLRRTVTAIFALGLMAGLAACDQPAQEAASTPEKVAPTPIQFAGAITDNPLPVQLESKVVTDPSLWGRFFIFERSINYESSDFNNAQQIIGVMRRYHRFWLDRQTDRLADLLDKDVIRFRQGQGAFGKDAVLGIIAQESRGERPEGFQSSLQMIAYDGDIVVDGRYASATYRVQIRGGARWEFGDLATIWQTFKRFNDGWKIVSHVESWALGDGDVPFLPESVPDRVTPLQFDFLYPADNIDRAVAFYRPLLGRPVEKTDTHAAFKMGDAFFELTTEPFDDRIVLKNGQANGLALVNVNDLSVIADQLKAIGDESARQVACGAHECLVTEDTAGNLIAWRWLQPVVNAQRVSPDITMELSTSGASGPQNEIRQALSAWLTFDWPTLTSVLTEDTLWIDDSAGLSTGADDIVTLATERWRAFDRGKDGVDADVKIGNVRIRNLGLQALATFELELSPRSGARQYQSYFVKQVWRPDGAGWTLEQSYIARKDVDQNVQVDSMDYTAYPATDQGVAGRYYKTLFGAEPYRDEAWFGFWSTSGVFGLAGPAEGPNPYVAMPHRSNGYANFSIASADEVLATLQQAGAALPQVDGINDQAGIDSQPGYRQILAVDSEGNLVNFSQYLDY